MSRLPAGRRNEGRRARKNARRMALEPLEPKTLMAIFTVTSAVDPTGDAPENTLRGAIEAANETEEIDTIRFNLPADQRVILLQARLPEIEFPVTINGATQPEFAGLGGLPAVEVRFDTDTGQGSGLEFLSGANGSTARGLALTNFPNNGIHIRGADDIFIENMSIGVSLGRSDVGNGEDGILIEGASGTRIGRIPERGNEIRGNGGNGISIVGFNSIENEILYNSIADNGGLGIDLNNNGVTPNDPTDSDGGPNLLQNYPVISSAATLEPGIGTTITRIEASLQSRPNTTYRIQLFRSTNRDATGFGEGATFFRELQIQTDQNGFWETTLDLTNPVLAEGEYVTATATDLSGNTSEFSEARVVQFFSQRVDVSVQATASPNPVFAGRPLTYTATVANNNFNPAILSDDVELVVQLPETMAVDTSTFVTSNGVPVDFDPATNTIRVNFGVLAGQEAETLTFEAIPTLVRPVRAEFTVTGGVFDQFLGNNQASVSTQVNLEAGSSVVEFRVREFTVGEAGGEAVIEVLRSNAFTEEVQVGYRTLDGTATEGVDYEGASGTITFAPGQSIATFAVPILDNAIFQANRTLGVELFDPVASPSLANPSPVAILGERGQATLTIFDNDPAPSPPQFLQFAQGQVEVLENAGQVSLVVQRVGSVAGNVSIPFATVAGSALPGRDFTPVSGTLTFLSGESEKTIVVPIVNNAVAEGNLSFGVNLGAGIGAAPGDPSSVQVTIVDDESPLLGTFQFASAVFTAIETDGTALITVTRTGGSGPATIGYATSPGTAVPGVRYESVSGALEFAEGETEKTFTVPLIASEGFTEPQTVLLNLAVPEGGTLGGNGQAVLTISDSEQSPSSIVQFTMGEVAVDESAGVATVTINRLGLAVGTVSVTVFTGAGEAVPGVDYQSVSTVVVFADGETSKTVSIPIIDNSVFDADRAFGVFIADPVGNVTLGQPDSKVVVIRNNDADPVVPLVADVRGVGDGGFLESISINFTKPMDPSTLLVPSNYMVVAHGRDGVLGTADDRVIPIAGLEVAPGALGVSVLLATPVPAGQFVTIGVNGMEGGLADTSGNLLDGDGDGLAGGNFSTTLGRSSRITYRDHDGDLITYVVTGGGFVEVVRGTPGTGDIVRITNPVPGRSVLRGQVTRRPGGDGLAFIRRIEGIDPFGRVRSALRTPQFVDFSQLTPAAVDALLTSRARPRRR